MMMMVVDMQALKTPVQELVHHSGTRNEHLLLFTDCDMSRNQGMIQLIRITIADTLSLSFMVAVVSQ
jgi:hypothetical protein